MIIDITFKSPDGVHYAVDEVVNDLYENSDNQEEFDKEGEKSKIMKKLEKWITYSEYATIQFDLEAMTATVK